jgi:DNA invertase Pin-like site-specific DNA recombinase
MTRKVKRVEWVPQLPQRKKVAAYARVSSGKEAMLHSLSAQVSYYSRLIQQSPEWQYAGVYVDEAMTGTKKERDDFQRLLMDCRAGKVDIIITKSISRFARNTVTLLETVRELKTMDVDVFFEEQNIHSLSTNGELMLTVLASYAQEESLSASENQKWRIRKAFANGELVNWRFMFGYRIDRNRIRIDSGEAMIVHEIFNRAIAGESFGAISLDLNQRGIVRTLGGKWNSPRIHGILSNEKYTGDALLQKHFRNNHLEKRICQNTGELPMYYAAESHPPIITKDTFQAAQVVLKHLEKQTANRPRPHTSEFTGIIRCAYCGKNYKRVTSNGTVGWNCSTYQEQGKRFCHGKKIPEDILKEIITSILGLVTYDPSPFSMQIDSILVPEDNKLRFYFKNGLIKDRTWDDRSRVASWSTEMRETARQKALKRKGVHHGNIDNLHSSDEK